MTMIKIEKTAITTDGSSSIGWTMAGLRQSCWLCGRRISCLQYQMMAWTES